MARYGCHLQDHLVSRVCANLQCDLQRFLMGTRYDLFHLVHDTCREESPAHLRIRYRIRALIIHPEFTGIIRILFQPGIMACRMTQIRTARLREVQNRIHQIFSRMNIVYSQSVDIGISRLNRSLCARAARKLHTVELIAGTACRAESLAIQICLLIR